MSYPKMSSRVHLFEVDGKRILYDIHSCVFYEVDELGWDAVEKSTRLAGRGQIITELGLKYGRRKASEAVRELKAMEAKGMLFSRDPLSDYQSSLSPVSTLCLNVAHDCDLNCRYCFASAGTYGKGKARMPLEVACKAVDFLIENSGRIQRLTLCFFGGEPLLNFPVIEETVEYAKSREGDSGKEFRFNITTNGTMLTSPVRKFLAKNGFGVIFSIDGPRDIQDEMRPFKNGFGSYDAVSKNLKELTKEAGNTGPEFSIRATFTRRHLDISRAALHLVELGCLDISVEPAVLKHEELEIREQDLLELKEQYRRFAHIYIDCIRNGRPFSFFHFRHVLDQACRATRNLTQCGAGTGYLAVSSDGELYPCHRFVGKDEYLMGSVFDGIKRRDVQLLFNSAHVNNKKTCLRCWARYICGGGCHAYAIEFNGDIMKPYSVECELMKYRIELGAYMYTEIADKCKEFLRQFGEEASQLRPHLSPQINRESKAGSSDAPTGRRRL